MPYPRPAVESTPERSESLVEAIAAVAARAPDAPALVHGGTEWSYGELLDEVGRLAAGLASLGIGSGDVVAVVGANHPSVALAWLACARLGAVPSVLSATLPAAAQQRLLDHLQPAAVVLAPHAALHARAIQADRDAVLVHGGNGRAHRCADLMRSGALDAPYPVANDLVEITCTSGTTGLPKAVCFTNGAHLLSRRTWIARLALAPDDRVYTFMPLHHASGVRNSLLAALLSGACCILADSFQAATFWSNMATTRGTFFMYQDAVAAELLRRSPSPADRCHRVRLACGAGRAALTEAFEARFGFRTLQNYGLTEIGSATGPPRDLDAAELHRLRHHRRWATFIGTPLGGGTEVRVVGAQGGDSAPDELGELWLRSPSMFSGYLGDEAATRRALQDGWIHSGDLGLRDAEGWLWYVGRADEVAVRQGEPFSARDVEDAVRSHPDVADAAVVIGGDPPARTVHALVVGHPDAPLDAAAVRAWCADNLPAPLVPDRVEPHEGIVRNAMGRVDRARLRSG